MRTAFIHKIIDLAKFNEKIYLLVGDLGFNVVEPFAELYPERFLNVGIAEQNMAGIATGLAMEGYCVFIYSIGNFPTLRCLEQIRYDICYHNQNVKIVAVGGGFAYGSLGVSHQATEEMGIMRTLPNMVVCAPGDPIETSAVTAFAANHNGPCYIRLGKSGETIVHNQNSIGSLSPGEIIKVKHEGGVAVFSTGSMLSYVVDFIENHKIKASVFSFPFIKPIDREVLAGILNTHKKIITIEEHQSQCGFGSAILEIVNDLIDEGIILKDVSIKRIAIKDKFFSIAGSQEYLRKVAGLELHQNLFN